MHPVHIYICPQRVSYSNRHYHGSYGEKYGINVYLSTDEPSIYDELDKYSQYNWFFNREGSESAKGSNVRDRLDDKKGEYNALFDLVTLNGTNHFVGTLSSHFGRVIYELYANKYVEPANFVESLDESWYGYV